MKKVTEIVFVTIRYFLSNDNKLLFKSNFPNPKNL